MSLSAVVWPYDFYCEAINNQEVYLSILLIHFELLYTQVTGFQIILNLAKLNLLKEKEKHNSLLNLMFNFVSLFNIHYSIK